MLRFISGFVSLAAIAGVIGTSTVHAEPDNNPYSRENYLYMEWQNFTPYRYEVVRKYKSDCIHDEFWYIIVDRDNNIYPNIARCLRNNETIKLIYEVNSLEGPKWKAKLEYVKINRDHAQIDIAYIIEPAVNKDRLLLYCGGQDCKNQEVTDKLHPDQYKVKIVKPLIKRTAMGMFYQARP